MHSLHKTRNSRPRIYKIIVKMNESKLERKEEWGEKHVLWPNFTQHKLDMTVMIELSQVLANEAVFMVGKGWHILAILIYHFWFHFGKKNSCGFSAIDLTNVSNCSQNPKSTIKHQWFQYEYKHFLFMSYFNFSYRQVPKSSKSKLIFQ